MNKLNHIIAALNDGTVEPRSMLEAVIYYYPTISKIALSESGSDIYLWQEAIDMGLDNLPDEVFEVCDLLISKMRSPAVTVMFRPTVGWFSNFMIEMMKRQELSSVSVINVHDPDNMQIVYQHKDRKRQDADVEMAVGAFLLGYLKYASNNDVDFSVLRSYVKQRDLITFGV